VTQAAAPGAESLARRTYNRTLSTFFLGSDVSTWRRLLRENRFTVDPEFLPRAALITAASLYNSRVQVDEERRFGAAVATAIVPPPLIVLGHWRSGLAQVQRMLGLDDQFAFPNLHQVRHPRTFLSTEAAHVRATSWMLPVRHPGDGLSVGHALPEEDEYALANLAGVSPYLGALFPRRRSYYVSTYLTLDSASVSAVSEWKRALATFARKLTVKHGRPLVLRSPLHTGRLRHLLDVFPGARVLHVRRNPYAVFQATCRSTRIAQPYNRLQRSAPFDVAAFVLDRYTRLYDAFFRDRALVRPDRLCEIRIEDVRSDPVQTLRTVYESLALPGFERVRRRLEASADGSPLQRANGHDDVDLEPELRARVAQAWLRSFETWEYPLDR
jgi:omega-hydroxy-beta-dihydromenaquinone-9 sulfotransferase